MLNYILNMGVKRYLPLLGMGVGAGAAALWATYHGILEQWGVTYFTWPLDPSVQISGPCILVELDTLSKAAIVAIGALIPVVLRALEHHALNPVLPTAPPPQTTKGDQNA